MRSLAAISAYQKSSAHRNWREQEADLFLQVNASLGSLELPGNPLPVAKAIADNDRLWLSVMDMVRDPANQLPLPLRAAVLSLGHAARREMSTPEPDMRFLIGINEQIAAGLLGY